VEHEITNFAIGWIEPGIAGDQIVDGACACDCEASSRRNRRGRQGFFKDYALTQFAYAGYLDAPSDPASAYRECPHWPLTSKGLGWMLGAYFKRTGRPAPHGVCMLHDYILGVGDMRIDMSNPIAPVVLQQRLLKGWPGGIALSTGLESLIGAA
jgi:hypothetical protein